MRTLIAAVTLVVFAGTVSRAIADGCMIPKEPVGQRSLAADISEPAQKALVIHCRGQENLILQVSFRGQASEFAWLVPSPSTPKVTKVDAPVFHILHELTTPKVRYRMSPKAAATAPSGADRAPDVQVIEEKQVGAYDIAVLRAGNAADLVRWLKTNGYVVSSKLRPVLAEYISRGWVFTAMRVNIAYQAKAAWRLRNGVLQSLRFTFPTSAPVYPLRVSSLNEGRSNVLLYVIADYRVYDPMLNTVCSIQNPLSPSRLKMYDLGVFLNRWHSMRLTKLAASLRADQMTRDIVLRPSANNGIISVGGRAAMTPDNPLPRPAIHRHLVAVVLTPNELQQMTGIPGRLWLPTLLSRTLARR